MPAIHIFKAGTHTDMHGTKLPFTQSDLAACVKAYDPSVHEAPLVIGHPKTEDPAWGWVKSLSLNGGDLLADPDQLDPQFAELVGNGRFKKVSASFYLPDSPNNPKPGTLYLRHVGFLGAQPPSVKGLGTVQFAENEDGVVDFMSPTYAFELISDIFRRQRDALIESIGAEEADKQFPNWVIDSLKEVIYAPMVKSSESVQPSFSEHPNLSDSTSQTLQTKTAREIELEQQLATATATLAAQKAAEQQSLASDFAENLVEAGQLPPKLKEKAVALLISAQQNEQVVNFSEGEQSFAEGFKALLSDLPKIIEFGEQDPKRRVDPKLNTPENPLIADAKSRSA